MATPENKFDPILDDLRERDVVDLEAAPVGKKNGYLGLVDDELYYFSNGHRYKITATLDDPEATPFDFIDGDPFEFVDGDPFEFIT